MPTDSTVERAFELARGGSCRSIDDIRRRLQAEGYGNILEHLASAELKKQLKALIRGT